MLRTEEQRVVRAVPVTEKGSLAPPQVRAPGYRATWLTGRGGGPLFEKYKIDLDSGMACYLLPSKCRVIRLIADNATGTIPTFHATLPGIIGLAMFMKIARTSYFTMTIFHERTLPESWTLGVHLLAVCDWALAQMPCPAFRCDATGGVSSFNSAAERIWGGLPLAGAGRWGGFVALWRCDGTPVETPNCPAALAAAGARILPSELLAETMDGQLRRVVFHARSILDAGGRPVGALCALTDVSERRRLECDAQAAHEERDIFLTMLGHELRNPLNPILSAATSLRSISNDPSIVRLAEVVERQAKQLGRFIADLLDTSRLRGAARVPIVIRDTTVGEVLDLAIDIVTSAAAFRDQTLAVEVGDRSAPLRCDPERLAQALGNALLNASEYSHDGAQIRLDAVIANEIFQARVSDDGAGVEQGRLAEIFEPFKSFSGAHRKESPAAGMGLWVAKNIADAHGGVVFARSGGAGAGTTVVFALPIANTDPEGLNATRAPRSSAN